MLFPGGRVEAGDGKPGPRRESGDGAGFGGTPVTRTPKKLDRQENLDPERV
jgi:hypothetical protein